MRGAAARERLDLPSPGPGERPGGWRAALVCLLPLALAAVRWYPITGNYFFADDFLNLFEIADDPLRQYLVTPNGGHVLLTRNAIFYLTWLLAGTDPRAYYWTVFLTHLVNVALLFGVIRVMTSSLLLAAFGAALWGTSPLHEGTLGWYSVYGQVLVATVILVILRPALGGMERPPTAATRALWYFLALAAASAFGIGTAVAVVLPLVLWLLLPAHARGTRPPLVSLVVTVPVLYVAQVWLYQRLAGVDMYKGSAFLLLLSDAWAIAHFWIGLVAFGIGRLLTGPLPLGPRPIWYTILAGFGVIALAAARAADATGRRRLLACTLLVVTAYGIIALGRGALTTLITGGAQDAVPLVPRYHYVGQLCLTLLLCAVAARGSERLPGWVTGTILATWSVGLLAIHVAWGTPVDNHADARATTHDTIAVIRSFIVSAPRGAPVYIHNAPFLPMPYVPVEFPGWAAVFTIFFPTNVVDGHRIHFIEANPMVIRARRSHRRTPTLLVPPFLGHTGGGA